MAEPASEEVLAPPPARREPDAPALSASRKAPAPRPLGLVASAAAAFEHRRLFVLIPFAMILGLVLYCFAPAEPQVWAAVAGLLAGLLAMTLSQQSPATWRLAVLGTAIMLGFALMVLHGAVFGTPMLSGSAYGTYEARVAAILSEGDGERRIVLAELTPVPPARMLDIRTARVVVRNDAALDTGDRIRATLRLAEVGGPVLPGGYDSAFHAYFSGIGAFGTALGEIEVIETGAASPFTRTVETVRRGIGERIAAALDPPASGIARALIIGDQTLVGEAERDVMATAGIVHVLSVSGLHLSLVAGGVFAIVRLLLALSPLAAQRLPVKAIAAVAGIAVALAYYALASGATGNIPALRATVTIILVLGAVLFGRRALTMRNVAIAAIVVIVTDPASVLRPSFQLSFAAVVALIGVYELLRTSDDRERGWRATAYRYVGGSLLTSLVAGAATALFAAYHFQQFAPLGALGNLLTMLLVSFVMMPFAILSVLAMPFGFEALPLAVMGWSIDRMLDAAHLVAGWSGSLEAAPVLNTATLAVGLAALAWFAFFANRWRLAGPIVLVPVVLLFGFDARPDVLVADTTQALAMRSEGGLALLAGRTGTFAVDVWSERYGEIGPLAEEERQCDGLGCVAQSSAGFSLALVEAPDAFAEDCARNDLVVTRLSAPSTCRAQTRVVDGDDLDRGGVHWLRWTGEGFETRAAVTDQSRPWRAAPR